MTSSPDFCPSAHYKLCYLPQNTNFYPRLMLQQLLKPQIPCKLGMMARSPAGLRSCSSAHSGSAAQVSTTGSTTLPFAITCLLSTSLPFHALYFTPSHILFPPIASSSSCVTSNEVLSGAFIPSTNFSKGNVRHQHGRGAGTAPVRSVPSLESLPLILDSSLHLTSALAHDPRPSS